MTVWIVIRNGDVDEVFDNKEAANHHVKNLNRKWAITYTVEREVRSI